MKTDEDGGEEETEQCPQTPKDPQGPSTSAEAVATEGNDDSLWKKGLYEFINFRLSLKCIFNGLPPCTVGQSIALMP